MRIPLVVISPYAKQNYVDHTMLDQASVVRFIEDNWLGGQRIGGGSFDATAGDLRALFDFTSKPNTTPLYLDPTLGTVLKRRRRSDRYVVTAWPAQHAPAVSV